MTPSRLSTRALNRALLVRQWPLERRDDGGLGALEHLVGLQAQAPTPPYFGLWSRLTNFHPDDLSSLLVERRAVRIVLMRGTVHLVSAGDALTLRPLVQPILDRDLRVNRTYAGGLAGLDLTALADAARAVLAEQPRSMQELRPLLAERFPDHAPASLAYAARNLLPLVQVPPRGLWGQGGQPRLATTQEWLGRPLEERPSPDDLVLRYLGAFGPAGVNDVQTWSGLTRLREVLERLRPRLVTFHDEAGRELFDLPGAPRPPEDTPAPPRLVAAFDNLTLSHADRRRVMSDEARRRVFSTPNVFPHVLLIGGFVAGSWSFRHARGEATITVEALEKPGDLPAVEAEARRLLRLAAPHAAPRVVITTPS